MKVIIKIQFAVLLLLLAGCSPSPQKSTPTPSRKVASIPQTPAECRERLRQFLSDSRNILDEKFGLDLKISPLRKPAAVKIAEEVKTESDELVREFRRANGPHYTQGKFKMVVDPKEALASRIMMIRNAKDTIDISYYIFKDTESSRIILAELRAALRRGVNVRLMVDGSGSVISGLSFYREIQTLNKVKTGMRFDKAGKAIGRAKFEAVVINPLFNMRANLKQWYNKVAKMVKMKEVPLEHFSIFQRSHDKILLVDSAIPENSMAMIGGRNISNDYFAIADKADNAYNDLDIIIKGTSYPRIQNGSITIENNLKDHFDKLYTYTANKHFNDFIFKVSRSKAAKSLLKIRKDRNANAFSKSSTLRPLVDKMTAENYLNKDFDEGYVSFLNEYENLKRENPLKASPSLYANNDSSIMKNLWSQIERAKHDILLCSPYIYLRDDEIAWLVKWLKEDPTRKLRIMTNSSATSDNLFAQSMVENFVMPKLLASLEKEHISPSQFEINAFGNMNSKAFGGTEAQGKLHAKFWMIDNYAMGVGTSNFDPVSRLTNSEVMANVFPVEGKASAESLNKYYENLKSKSTAWGSEEFNEVKYNPQLKKKLVIQAGIAKILKTFDLLPQSPN